MTTALPRDAQAQPDDTAARIEELTALAYVILSRLAQVEETVALLAERAGLTAPPVDAAEKVTVKRAAHELGCSVPNVYRLIRLRRLTSKKHAGRVLVTADSIKKQRERIAVRS
jgi:hypothetical protein